MRSHADIRLCIKNIIFAVCADFELSCFVIGSGFHELSESVCPCLARYGRVKETFASDEREHQIGWYIKFLTSGIYNRFIKLREREKCELPMVFPSVRPPTYKSATTCGIFNF